MKNYDEYNEIDDFFYKRIGDDNTVLVTIIGDNWMKVVSKSI